LQLAGLLLRTTRASDRAGPVLASALAVAGVSRFLGSGTAAHRRRRRVV